MSERVGGSVLCLSLSLSSSAGREGAKEVPLNEIAYASDGECRVTSYLLVGFLLEILDGQLISIAAWTSVSPEIGANSASSLDSSLQSMVSHRSVLGCILLSRSSPASIIRHSGVVFEGEQGRKYATAIKRMVDAVQSGLEDMSSPPSVSKHTFLRLIFSQSTPG